MTQKIINHIITLIIGGLVAWAIIPKDHGEKAELKKQIKSLLNERDSIIKVENVLARRDSLWSRTHASDRDSLLMARKQANHWQNEYKNIRSAPVVHYSEPQIDSAVDALISARFHKTP